MIIVATFYFSVVIVGIWVVRRIQPHSTVSGTVVVTMSVNRAVLFIAKRKSRVALPEVIIKTTTEVTQVLE